MKTQKRSRPVDSRVMARTGLTRLRFYNLKPDQVETIKLALNRARSISGTEHDSVALEIICIDFLGGGHVVGNEVFLPITKTTQKS